MKQPRTVSTPCHDPVHTGVNQKIFAEHRVHIPRPRPRPRPKTLRKGLGGMESHPEKPAAYGLKASSRDDRSYEWPEPLYPLRDWLHKHGVDVGALKSERQALWLAKRLGRQGKKMPHRLQPLFPALLKVQRTLCQTTTITQNAAFCLPGSGRSERGTFGPASPVRSINIAAYQAMLNGGLKS